MDNSNNHARIGEHEVPVVRFKLRAWLKLEEIHTEILDAAKHGDRDKFVLSMYSYVSVASLIPIEELETCYWADITRAYVFINNYNTPNLNLPLIKPRPEKREKLLDQKEGWEYLGRSWYLWGNLFAKVYGWTLEYIAELDVNDSFALMQEILVDEQLQREWEWSLSESAFSYDATTKKSKYVPLKRPGWMGPTVNLADIPNVKIRSSEMPVGLIYRWEDGKSNQPQ